MSATRDRPPIVGVFHDSARALAAVQELEGKGFSRNAIGVLSPSHKRADQVAHAGHVESEPGMASIADEVAAALAGVGAFAVPGIGPVSSTGMLAAALDSATSGEGEGAITGALVGMGISVDAASQYEDAVRGGGILVVVDAGARAAEARQVLEAADATVVH